jgi:hypothetical protein
MRLAGRAGGAAYLLTEALRLFEGTVRKTVDLGLA